MHIEVISRFHIICRYQCFRDHYPTMESLTRKILINETYSKLRLINVWFQYLSYYSKVSREILMNCEPFIKCD